jgi:hypothetical protein
VERRPDAGPTQVESRSSLVSRLWLLPFLLLSVGSLTRLARVFQLRWSYPLDLEWMEGGMLVHALRLARGLPLYGQPSVDFVSFLYTPLYPAVLSALSKVFGLSYALGRSVSILAFLGALVFLVAAVRGVARQYRSEPLRDVAGTAGLLGAAAVGLAFPFCGAFYDLVRCDSLWLCLVAAGLYCCSEGRSPARIVLGALLLALGFFTKQTAAPFMLAAAAAVCLTSGLRPGLLFSLVAFGSSAAAILAGQRLTGGWLWVYIFRLHQSHQLESGRIWPETPRLLFDYGFVLLLPIAVCFLIAAGRLRLSRATFYWAWMALAGVATAALGSATQGAYDNAYIPAVYFGALLSAACVVELAALGAGVEPSVRSAVFSAGAPAPARPASLRILALLGLCALGAHAVLRWPDMSALVPGPRDRAEARRLIDFLVEEGPDVFVPSHPFYNVLAGGSGHLHVMSVNDVYLWPRAITSDPVRDAAVKQRFRESLASSFRSRRWAMVIQDDCDTPRLFGLATYYRLVEDLAASGRAPRPLSGDPCAPRYVWVPRG